MSWPHMWATGSFIKYASAICSHGAPQVPTPLPLLDDQGRVRQLRQSPLRSRNSGTQHRSSGGARFEWRDCHGIRAPPVENSLLCAATY